MTGADGDHLLVAKLDDVHVITTMLKTINFKESAMVGLFLCLTAMIKHCYVAPNFTTRLRVYV